MSSIKLMKREIAKEKQLKMSLFLLLVFTFLVSTHLDMARFYKMTAFEFTLYSMSDHYYLIYGYFFFLLFWISQEIRNVSSIELIRLKNKRQFYSLKFISVGVKVFLFVFAHIFIAFIIAVMNLPLANTFNGAGADSLYTAFFTTFKNPFSGIIIVSLYLWLGSVFLHQLLFYTNEICGAKGFLIGVLLILVSTIFGFITNLDMLLFTVFFPNNYFIFHHSYLSAGRLTFYFIFCFMLNAPFIFSRTALKAQSKGSVSSKKSYIDSLIFGKISVIVSIIIVLLLLQLIQIISNGYNALDFLFLNLRGYSSVTFNLIEFLVFLAVYTLPLFILCAFWEKEKDFKNNIGQFRYGSRKNWNLQIEKISRHFIVKYLLMHFGLMAIFALLINIVEPDRKSFFLEEILSAYFVSTQQLIVLAFICIILKCAELYLIYLIGKFIYKASKSTILAFLLSFAGYILTVFKFAYSNVVPFGISSLYRLLEIGLQDICYHLIPLVAAIICMYHLNKNIEKKVCNKNVVGRR